jgi:hypothetical protein
MMDQEKNKISKEAVCHTKKITQKHAQLTSWLHVCALFCSEEEISITQDLLTRCKKLQDFFHSSRTLIPAEESIKRKKSCQIFLSCVNFSMLVSTISLCILSNHLPCNLQMLLSAIDH